MPKRRVNLCISEEAWQRLKQLAQQRRISASAAVEQAIESAVESEEARRQRAIAAWEAVKQMESLGPMPDPDELCALLDDMFEPIPGLKL